MNSTKLVEDFYPTVSVVSPVYRAEEVVDELVARITETMESADLTFEVILVDDRSPDNSWIRIAAAAKKDSRIKALRLSRNFGQPAAISAGVHLAKGKYIVVMDCDLQDNPKYIPQMIAKSKEGHDIVFTKKLKRGHSFLRNMAARSFISVYNWLVENPFLRSGEQVGSLSLVTRRVADAYKLINDSHRHYGLVLRWLGFQPVFMAIEHEHRFAGESSYTFKKLINHAIDGITSQSTRLLRLSISVGFGFCFLSLLTIVVLVAMYFTHGFQSGWTSLVVLNLFSTGVILLSLGAIGIYLGKTFEQAKGRPLYIVSESLNTES